MREEMRQLSMARLLAVAAILCLTPLFGVLFLGLPLSPFLHFPPLTRHIQHAPFQWPAFYLLLLFIAATCLPFVRRLISFGAVSPQDAGFGHPFPWWGWLGIAVTAVSWVVAWNRFSFMAPLQRYTFSPLWLGYVLVVNGLTCMRAGRSLLRSRPRYLAWLFPASALFWWYFEFLNRFAENWHYHMGGEVSTAEYVIHATVCFSTVLPAVLSTAELLGTLPRLTLPFATWHAVDLPAKREIGFFLLLLAVLSLCFLLVFPDFLFPMLWIAPLLVIVGMQLAGGLPTIFAGVAKGDWRQVVMAALAALVCGFFWEMWNWRSLAHWEYSIPFVQRFRIFAMPLLGYAGYLPFGLECAAVADLIAKKLKSNEENIVLR